MHSRQHWHRQWSFERDSGQSSSRFTRLCAVAGKPRRRFLGASSTVSTRDVSWQALILGPRQTKSSQPAGMVKHAAAAVNFHGYSPYQLVKDFVQRPYNSLIILYFILFPIP